MIKKILLFLLFAVGPFLTSWADEQKKIILNDNDHRTETVEFPYWNIFVSIKDIDDNDNVQIEVELENTDDFYNLYLFDRAYAVKELKKMKPSISYDKGCPKTSIEACFDINSPIKLAPSQKTDLFVKTGNINAPIVFKLPIHIAKNKNKNKTKILLWDIVVVEIELQVQLKPDTDYINIEESYNTLIRAIDSEVFCTNKDHKGTSYKSLKSEYEGRINDLKKKINSIIDTRFESGKDIKKFRIFIDNLDTISIDSKVVNSCPKDRKKSVPGHNCKNCNLTYEQIYNKLDDYYIKINIGKMKKAQVMSEVESLYTCVSKNTKRSANNSMRSRIITYYNKIKSL